MIVNSIEPNQCGKLRRCAKTKSSKSQFTKVKRVSFFDRWKKEKKFYKIVVCKEFQNKKRKENNFKTSSSSPELFSNAFCLFVVKHSRHRCSKRKTNSVKYSERRKKNICYRIESQYGWSIYTLKDLINKLKLRVRWISAFSLQSFTMISPLYVVRKPLCIRFNDEYHFWTFYFCFVDKGIGRN